MLLLIDNFDSFTHNLARYFVELGEDVQVIRNDQLSVADIDALAPQKIVISPGPCTPDQSGISLDVIRYASGQIPLLGVCLGHQAIGQVFGARIIGARHILHGKVSAVNHADSGLFTNLPSPFNATRYHSLVIDPATLPAEFQVDAWCQESQDYREIMAISHITKPIWGIQFHPESLLTEHGHIMLNNFLSRARTFRSR
ncbi:anthranilate synthase component II [Salinimonas chungwhensis]|uniref:anthranilate synthase component II n=1 Tax=Salinimonas chungwhensis TaxID=265425 RepID=UPI00037E014D|nr:aminodeoxychorismate/anthranilate synthase component II [Salinimonas chungwhensis]